MNTVYIATFDMKTAMHSIGNKSSSSLVDKKMIKVGISKNFLDRKKQYENTYKCSSCNKSHVNFKNVLKTSFDYKQCKELEVKVKKKFEDSNVFGEYYRKESYQDILNFLLNKIELKDMSIKKINKIKSNNMNYSECRFIRTTKEINKKHAPHNIARWNWIENNGKGRTYGEIDLADSVYRKNIKTEKYGGNDSSINSHLGYDIKQKMIRAEKIEKEF